MYKAFSNYQYYNTMMFQLQKNSKNLILEPLSCILKLILLQYKEKGTKISISNNSILFNNPNYIQGICRFIDGDCREDLHNLYHPLLKATQWYPLNDYKLLYLESKKGLELLKNVYNDNTTIHHTISHYIDIVSGTNTQKIPDTNPIIDTLKDIWQPEEITAIHELLKLIQLNKNRDIYLKSIEDIVSAKEKIVNQYIHKVSTTY
ncbi:MAG: hypothetical protein CL926_13640 [Deltaproteobacteria bacterium]|nr:hypothetical protein [Deltaproteobacteria bacterium]